MSTILDQINTRKRVEISQRKKQISEARLIAGLSEAPPVRAFEKALRTKIQQGEAAVIAEIKKASPSKGVIRQDFHPTKIARSYQSGGAACLSVLTDRDFFQGSERFLQEARAAVELPVIRKDFLIDPYQIIEARAIGADCVLLIVASLESSQLRELHSCARQLDMDVLIEVHDGAELETALQIDDAILGINNRDLHSFKTDLQTTLDLLPKIPAGRLVVTESGIQSTEQVAKMREAGVQAFLVGEAFMREPDPGVALAKLFFS